MSNLIPFQFDTSTVRVITTDDDVILFVARDVATALGYADTINAVKLHCKKAKSLKDIGVAIHHPQQNQQLDLQTKVIPESDVYRLVMRSKLESAETFQDWLVEEVIPSIRKTGGYQLKPTIDPMTALNDPAMMRGLLLTYTEKVITLEAKVEEIQPKADALDRIATATDGALCPTDAAKMLQVQPKKLIGWLQANKWMYKRAGSRYYVGYQDKIQTGYLEHKEKAIKLADGSDKMTCQVLVTAKGLAKLSSVVSKGGAL